MNLKDTGSKAVNCIAVAPDRAKGRLTNDTTTAGCTKCGELREQPQENHCQECDKCARAKLQLAARTREPSDHPKGPPPPHTFSVGR